MDVGKFNIQLFLRKLFEKSKKSTGILPVSWIGLEHFKTIKSEKSDSFVKLAPALDAVCYF